MDKCFVDAKLEKEVKAEIISQDALSACKKFGAYEVRKAAIRQMDGESGALVRVGLQHHYSQDDLIIISTEAFEHMTKDEIFHEFGLNVGDEIFRAFCLNVGMEYSP